MIKEVGASVWRPYDGKFNFEGFGFRDEIKPSLLIKLICPTPPLYQK